MKKGRGDLLPFPPSSYALRSQKYGYAPDAIEEKVLESQRFREIYDFYILVEVKEHAERYERADIKKIRFYVEN